MLLRWLRQVCVLVAMCVAISFGSRDVSAQAGFQDASCDQLWIARNSIFARRGFCFKTEQAQAFFGLACFPPYGELSSVEQDLVNSITRWEVAKGCNVSVPTNWRSAGVGKIDVFVMAGGDRGMDACSSIGEIAGLDPRGDGFLSVRSGPGGQPFSEMDRLFNGNRVYICDQRGPWIGVVYEGPGQATAGGCGVATPWALRQPYSGPCRYGWIHSRYVRGIAG